MEATSRQRHLGRGVNLNQSASLKPGAIQAVAFARWISPDFAVWADLHIDALLRGELTEKQAFDRACKQLEDGRQLASLHGKGLADWKFKKPMLEHRVDEMRDRLQMVLGLEAA
ncbi:TPA: hypothetical protein M5Q67_006123 [Pseudomonas aeruginosa]|nr:hypothetical protein [Pseudomonas aeruginosa]